MTDDATPPGRPRKGPDRSPSDGRPAVLILTDLAAIARHLALVTACEDRGLEPVLVFGPETPPEELEYHHRRGHPAVRVPSPPRVSDYGLDATLEAAGPYLRGGRLRAVLACGESFVETAGTLAETLGLPGTGGHAARVCRHKTLQRLAAPTLAPRWTGVHARTPVDGDTWHHYPAVLKPTGRMCSSGVHAIADADALRAQLPTYPDDEPLLIEERVEGPEFSVESLVHEGDIVWAGITAKQTNEHTTRFFTETGHLSPAAGLPPEAEKALLTANATLLRSVRFGSGISHAEFRLSGNRAVLMEIAARLPGDAITRLWHLAHAVPLEPAVLDLALGIRPPAPRARRRAQQLYLEHSPGLLREVECPGTEVSWTAESAAWPDPRPAPADAPPRRCAVLVGPRRGTLLGEAADSFGRAVSVVTDASLDQDVAEFTHRTAKEVAIRTEEPPAD
ncbi:ATP-grasp domain-containing protein [Actinacidiphila paucisporea]|uniref:Biotin carboxylase n=1 Tax=Actinacidiphila paucisporea TaxID=310782 RepID=A0A1M7Q9V0_9ACTN|nr:ATP-grasp domain-containing protein [Actinacidiphila paucisporea]SHN27249.1 Biotin carboxylase [Actinacidiphila paucisporea]